MLIKISSFGRSLQFRLVQTDICILITVHRKRMRRRKCAATCCVLLKPVEFVRELFPAYNPDVVVKVPPLGKKNRPFELCIDHIISKNMIKSAALPALQWQKWNGTLLEGTKRLVFCETTIWGGEQREALGSAPNSGLIFPLFLSYQWLDQAWWMTEGGREGWGSGQNLPPKSPRPAQCEGDKRRLCVSYRRVESGKGGGERWMHWDGA